MSYICVAHKCKHSGCGKVFVIDGNQKNRQDVCAASEAGVIEYDNLPGYIKSGCQLSPSFGSKYCFFHSPRVSSITPNSDAIDVNESDQSDGDGVVRFITDKRTTRNEIHYQVLNVV